MSHHQVAVSWNHIWITIFICQIVLAALFCVACHFVFKTEILSIIPLLETIQLKHLPLSFSFFSLKLPWKNETSCFLEVVLPFFIYRDNVFDLLIQQQVNVHHMLYGSFFGQFQFFYFLWPFHPLMKVCGINKEGCNEVMDFMFNG